MNAMTRLSNQASLALLDAEAWEVPRWLSDEELYAEAGADRRAGSHPLDDREDDR